MGPPKTRPSGVVLRYMTASVQEASFDDMPKTAVRIIQNTAPGPPTPTAMATPAMLPRPMVADRALDSAWKCEISPGSSGLS